MLQTNGIADVMDAGVVDVGAMSSALPIDDQNVVTLNDGAQIQLQMPDEEVGVTNPMLTNSILLEVETAKWGNSKKVDSNCVAADADKSQLTLSKALLCSDEVKAIAKLDNQIRQYLADRALPGIWKRGVYLLPNLMVTIVENQLVQYRQQRDAAVSDFINAYPVLVQQAQLRLRSLFNVNDYPGASMMAGENGPVVVVNGDYETPLRAMFVFQWRYLAFSQVPKVLAALKPELFAQEQARMTAELAVVEEEARNLVRVRLAKLVKRMTERLTPGEDGKAKVIKDAYVDNIAAFLNEFTAYNITNDADLEALVARTKALMQGVDGETLRKSKDLQGVLATGFSQIEAALDDMIMNKPSRAITFED